MLCGECFDTEMLEAKPFFDEGVGCKFHAAPSWYDFAVVDYYVGREGGAEAGFILVLIVSLYFYFKSDAFL